MTKITLTQRRVGEHSRKAVYHDSALQSGIQVATSEYIAANDRVYDTRGLDKAELEIENKNTSGSIVYKIESAKEEFDDISDLTDAKYSEEVGDVTVATSTVATAQVIQNMKPKLTALRLRLKNDSGGATSNIAGRVALN